jgi:cytochrome oxidase Cu insertion factor (SCO1/SenC/PrrC family)
VFPWAWVLGAVEQQQKIIWQWVRKEIVHDVVENRNLPHLKASSVVVVVDMNGEILTMYRLQGPPLPLIAEMQN